MVNSAHLNINEGSSDQAFLSDLQLLKNQTNYIEVEDQTADQQQT